MVVLNFIWYCIKCMLSLFSSAFGHTPEEFTIKEGLIGNATLVVLILLGFLILWLTGVIRFKTKEERRKEKEEKNKSKEKK